MIVASSLSWRSWLLLVHVFGCCVVGTFIARQLRQLRRLVTKSQPAGHDVKHLAGRLQSQLQVRRRVRVLESEHCDAPIAFGVVTPTIILPAQGGDTNEADLKNVLAHELAHLRQGDAWTNWMQLLLLAAWWFHPVFWFLHRSLRRVREECCDDVLIATGLATASDYCDTLLRVAAQPAASRSQVACGMADGLHPLANRLNRILDPSVRRIARLSLSNLALILIAAVVLLPGLSSQVTKAQERPSTNNDSEILADLPVAKRKVDRFSWDLDTAVGFEPLKVSGQCLDWNNKPVAGAEVRLSLNKPSGLKYVDADGEIQHLDNVIATEFSDQTGHFQFDIERFPVIEFRPEPVEKPKEATFSLLATADDYAVAWRGSRTVRFQDRPDVLDPIEESRTFFRGEPIRLDLVFQKEIILNGIVSDDLGTPLSGATVMVGLVRDERSLPGQKPRTYGYRRMALSSSVDASVGWGLKELPRRFREATTDKDGRYTIRGLSANVSASFSIDYKRTYPMFNGSVTMAKGESRRTRRYVGTSGKLDVAMTRPRTLTVNLKSESSKVPEGIVRVVFANPFEPMLRDGAMVESVDGIAHLSLPPGKYKLIAQPKPGQMLVTTTQDIEITQQPLEQTVDLNMTAGAEVVLRVKQGDSESAVEGVPFETRTSAEAPIVELQSQTVYVDHPRTNADGILKAIVPAGKLSVRPVVRKKESDTEPWQAIELEPGRSTAVDFDVTPTESTPATLTDRRLARLSELWDAQRKHLSRVRLIYRLNNYLRGEISGSEFEQVLERLQATPASKAEPILQHVFPSFQLSKPIFLWIDGRRMASGGRWSQPFFSWNGVDLSDLSIANGREQIRYDTGNCQLNIKDMSVSSIGIGGLQDVLTIPSPRFQVPDDARISERKGRTEIEVENRFLLVVDTTTGFVHEQTSSDGKGFTRIIRQYGPVKHANAAVTATVRVEAEFRNNELDRASVSFLDEVEFIDNFPTGTFCFAAPAGTNIVDYRDTDRGQVGSRPNTGVTRFPVPDVVALADQYRRARQQAKATATASEESFAPPAKTTLRFGDKAPALSVAGWFDQDGPTEAPNLKDKVVVLFFNEYAVEHGVDEDRTFRQSLKAFEGKNVEFVNIYNHKTDAAKAIAFTKKMKLPWKFAIDSPMESRPRSAGKTFAAFNVEQSTSVVLNASGDVLAAFGHTLQARYAIKTVDRHPKWVERNHEQ